MKNLKTVYGKGAEMLNEYMNELDLNGKINFVLFLLEQAELWQEEQEQDEQRTELVS